ncbi:MAG: glycosyltransferase [Anaerolineae bacterium]|nr:glycosyltransferase [Anaerolineae bacterium]
MANWKTRAAGITLLIATVWYIPWLVTSLNWQMPWLSLPFGLANLFVVIMTLVTALNHWSHSRPDTKLAAPGEEPAVAVIVPTYGEPPEMVYQTAKSVLDQDYPIQQIRLIISDDAHRPAMRRVVERMCQEYPLACATYHDPYRRGDLRRRGDAKSGNLNSALDSVDGTYADIAFVETRDADDLVGDPTFLRQVIGQLLADPKAAFVQTIKEAHVSEGDPFGNLEPMFYLRAMLARHAANSVFPCGSGLVWRQEALDDIGGFPDWNLVEDLQSGVEALRRGWRGVYLPIVGAFGQTAPEDTPNVIKQRGTWALDTMRLVLWANKKGLNFRQRLQFLELGLFYVLSFAVLMFLVTPIIALTFEIYPLVTDQVTYALVFWPYALAVELFILSLADGLPYEAVWRARQTWLGLAPVYATATILALIYGPNRKPVYRVTRKEHVYGWYWREVLPQMLLIMALIGASVYHVATRSLLAVADLGSLFWAVIFVMALSRTVINSWHGLQPLRSGLRAARHTLSRSVQVGK